ncbi:DeoR/GlpR transcriptional regulator [Roseibium sp. CAU 1637]|uniref:DeoR/GlpR transcriptional regulator n=1 Tax=Roseibium limicola TaxID=2816037 RepID=A0A939ES26_9HYPH|nr:DeoR/GlpR family DNA-binding transcription regulator [Roseibium limicola]MBO0346891.1 DeoR/GlpR transcriptional regulator [Roseibium limicola]
MLIARHNEILELARRDGRVSVDDLAQRFSVTPQTIRKDLNELCDRRLLARTHGGALLSSGIENVGYEARRVISGTQKVQIGQRVAELIPDNASLFLNIGTTTEAVAQALLQHRGLMVITNNINVAGIMRGYTHIEVVMAGGILRHSDGGIVGEAAVDFMGQFKADFAIVGASAIDPDGSLLDYDYREVRVTQTILQNARQKILVADSTKFERSAPVRIGQLSEVDVFVTDECPSQRILKLAREADVEVIETSKNEPASDTPDD